jgi:hypothetical protein
LTEQALYFGWRAIVFTLYTIVHIQLASKSSDLAGPCISSFLHHLF